MPIKDKPQTKRRLHVSQTTLIVCVAVTQICFINAISGVDAESNLRIVFGLVIQVALGKHLLSFLLFRDRITPSAQLGAGFVIGIFPVLLLGRGWVGVVMVGIPMAVIIFWGWKNAQSSSHVSVAERHESLQDLIPLVTSVVLCNLVFLRINQSVLGVAVLGISVTLLLVPKNLLSLALWLYSGVTTLTTAIRHWQIHDSAVFTHFRFFPDWTEEQVLARSLASTGSRDNPFILGDTISYHYLSQFYWGTFERLVNSEIFAFSGPALLACSVMATGLLLANSSLAGKLTGKLSERLILVLLLFGSWPFFDSFSLDNHSRSQSLSIAIGALTVFLVTKQSSGVWLVVIPLLLSAAIITKVTTGLFLCVLVGIFVIMGLGRDLFGLGRAQRSSDFSLTPLFGLILSAVSALITFVLVFVFPKSMASYGKLEFFLTSPDAYAADRQSIFWLQVCLACTPLLALCIFIPKLVHTGWPEGPDRLRFSVIIATVLSVVFWQVANSASSISGLSYAVGLSAVVSGLVFMDNLKEVFSRFLLIFSAVVILIFAASFLILERRPTPHDLVTEGVLVIGITFAFAMAVLSTKFSSVSQAFLVTVLLLCLGNASGVLLADRTNGKLTLRASPNDLDSLHLEQREVIKFLRTLEPTNVYAIEAPTLAEYASYGDSRIRHNVNLLGGDVRLQFWAEPHHAKVYFGDSTEVRSRLLRQNDLVKTPNARNVQLARQRGISHVLIFSSGPRTRWREFIAQADNGNQEQKALPQVIYSDEILYVVALN